MNRTAKLFSTGGSQAVRLPADFRFDATEVYIWKDPITGNVTLSLTPNDSWQTFASLRDTLNDMGGVTLPPREQSIETRDPFEGWQE